MDRRLHIVLLVTHIFVLCWMSQRLFHYYIKRAPPVVVSTTITGHDDGTESITQTSGRRHHFTSYQIAACLFVSNLIGVVFARSLHYQFYVWYYHSLPFLLWSAPHLTTPLRLAILASIEWVWNVYPATPTSSLVLVACHAILVIGLMFGSVPVPSVAAVSKPEEAVEAAGGGGGGGAESDPKED